MNKHHTLKWFQNRRGKTIYRDPIKTEKGERCCDMCEGTSVFVHPPKKGLPDQAQSLYDYQNELGIIYRDKL